MNKKEELETCIRNTKNKITNLREEVLMETTTLKKLKRELKKIQKQEMKGGKK